VVGTQVFAQPVMVLVAGKDFAESGTVLKILIWAVGFVFISSFFAHVMVALDKQRRIIPAYIFTALTSLIGYLYFIPRFSYFGAAAVTVYSEAAITVFMIIYTIRFAGFFPRLWVFIKAIIAALIMGASVYFLPATLYANPWYLLAALAGASAVYFLALFSVRGISRHDLSLLLNEEPQENELLAVK